MRFVINIYSETLKVRSLVTKWRDFFKEKPSPLAISCLAVISSMNSTQDKTDENNHYHCFYLEDVCVG